MKAAFVTDVKTVEIKEIKKPAIQDNEVLISVKSTGVCGSDLHLFNGTHAFRKFPAILGHEIAGKIIEKGKKVTRFDIGDRVTVEPHIGCKECEFCRNDYTNLCLNKKVPGTPQWNGTFVEYFNAPEETLYKIDDTISYQEGTVIEPLAVAIHLLNRASVKERNSIAILGTGSIGISTILYAKHQGWKNIICTDLSDFNRRMGLQCGADLALDPMVDDVPKMILAMTEGRGTDLTIIAAGGSNIINEACASTRRRGEMLLFTPQLK